MINLIWVGTTSNMICYFATIFNEHFYNETVENRSVWEVGIILSIIVMTLSVILISLFNDIYKNELNKLQ
jgi:hypothetical protein